MVRVLAIVAAAGLASAFEPIPWEEANAKASAMLSEMSREEKERLTRSWGYNSSYNGGFDPYKYWYLGNIQGTERLGIPSLNLQDAADGFRTNIKETVGTVTGWPSLLSLAATWDGELMHRFASALAQEFSAKGANVLLGPSVNVHRVAKNGRNFEYLSGEDPYLGSVLAAEYVRAVQSQGVMAVVKHWAFNQQETNRGSDDRGPFYDVVVDDKTAFELYYPPFKAAVDAGVAATMCAYNKINGDWACSSKRHLKEHLKGSLGFQGFVMSDWGATHSTAMAEGLDQDQHMQDDDDPYFQPHEASEADLNEAARRVLAAMYKMDTFGNTKCIPPACKDIYLTNATSVAHERLSLEAATESVVLLKNEGVLPLASTVKTIAVVGSAAVAPAYDTNKEGSVWNIGDYYSGGGSGHLVSSYVVTPLDGIKARAAQAGITVLSSTDDDVAGALAVAAKADVTIVVGATTSGEHEDRETLSLDNSADALIEAVAAEAKATVVLMQVPGTILTPWRDAVDAAAVLFLGGPQTGHAWASMLFGDHSPTGRLPIMLPESEADTIEPMTTVNASVSYSEGLQTSYRNRDLKAAFPFGHGLSYSSFDLKLGTVSSTSLSVVVTNTGHAEAKALPQLYFEFPEEANQPAPLLKGFGKTGSLVPKASAEVTFPLTAAQLSYFKDGAWHRVMEGVAHIGWSSADILLSVPFPTRQLELHI
jgi:beta-glucosidase